MTESKSLVERLAGEAGFIAKFNDTGERLAKFAELVARECMDAARDVHREVRQTTQSDDPLDSYEASITSDAANQCVQAIRQRFGVRG